MNERDLLARLGRGDWKIVSRRPEMHKVRKVDDTTGELVTTDEPTGNIIWVISDGKGNDDTLTVSSVPVPQGEDTSGAPSWEVVKPPAKDLPKGTEAKVKPTPASDLEIIKDPTTGRPIKYRDPSTGTVIDLPDVKDASRPQIINGQRGEILSWDGTSLKVLRAGDPKEAKDRQTKLIDKGDGSKVLVDADTGDTIKEFPRGTVYESVKGVGYVAFHPDGSHEVILPEKKDPTYTGGINDPTHIRTEGGERTAVPNPAYTPEGAMALQNYYDSVAKVQGMVQNGQMSPAEADAYAGALRENLNASLQGDKLTPFDLAKQKDEETRSRATQGREILNSRLTAGNTMLGTLMDALKPTGSNFDFRTIDPLKMARDATEEAGGGKEITEMAKALVMALKNPAAAGQPMGLPPPAAPGAATGGAPQLVGPAMQPEVVAALNAASAHPPQPEAAAPPQGTNPWELARWFGG